TEPVAPLTVEPRRLPREPSGLAAEYSADVGLAPVTPLVPATVAEAPGTVAPWTVGVPLRFVPRRLSAAPATCWSNPGLPFVTFGAAVVPLPRVVPGAVAVPLAPPVAPAPLGLPDAVVEPPPPTATAGSTALPLHAATENPSTSSAARAE